MRRFCTGSTEAAARKRLKRYENWRRFTAAIEKFPCALCVLALLTLGCGDDPVPIEASEGPVGAMCDDPGDCVEGLMCFDQANYYAKNGYCTVACDYGAPCPDPYTQMCVVLTGGHGNYCLAHCESDADCRDGTTCTDVPRTSQDVCFPEWVY